MVAPSATLSTEPRGDTQVINQESWTIGDDQTLIYQGIKQYLYRR
jgi:hypothetical protein